MADQPTNDDLLRFLKIAEFDNETISRFAGFACRRTPHFRARLIERLSSVIGSVAEMDT